ncbi:MAG: adenylyl-sulfate kinase [Crocinitomicaceae bacterium]
MLENNLKPRVFWLYGLSGAGKTTLSERLVSNFSSKQLGKIIHLDGDGLRNGINKDLGFSENDRNENIRRVAEIAKLMVKNGLFCVCSFITPSLEQRRMVEDIIGKEYLSTIFIDCPIEICEDRDVKGLYKKVRQGQIKNFTGISAPFDPPSGDDLIIRTNDLSVEESEKTLMSFVINQAHENKSITE